MNRGTDPSLESAVSSAVDELGDPSTWEVPSGYPSSLVLCAMDSLWSIGIRYEVVTSVIDRYLRARGFDGFSDCDSCSDSPRDFLNWVDSLGGDRVEALTTALGNRNRTSSRNGIPKAEVMIAACELFRAQDVRTTSDLLVREVELEPLWLQLHGQRSGISWRYLLMLAGSDGIKPDRMVHRFLSRHGFPSSLSPEVSVGELTKAVQRLHPGSSKHTSLRSVDFQIWMTERARSGVNPIQVEEELARFAVQRNWSQFHSVRNLFMALIGEVGELAELLQWKSDEEVMSFLSTPDGSLRFSNELADIYLYLVQIAQRVGLDLNEIALSKIDSNDLRYPIHLSKGVATKFSERQKSD